MLNIEAVNLLIVEDEERMASYLEKSLAAAGGRLAFASDYEELEALLNDQELAPPDVVVLDRLLNGRDSLGLLPQMKAQWLRSKFIVLSAITSSYEKSRALDLGADDYISKPFSIEELGARIRAVIRRADRTSAPLVYRGNVIVNLMDQTVEVNGAKTNLSRKEYVLLTLLLQNPGRVFSRYHLLDRVWDVHADIDSNVVEVTIKNLRKKLTEAGASVKIMNRRQVGYWLEA